MPIIEAILKRMKGRSRWIPHNFNPADGLTKLKGAHLAPLLDLLKTGMYHLKTEEAKLKERAVEKELLGHIRRNKQSGKPFKNPIIVSTNLFSHTVSCSSIMREIQLHPVVVLRASNSVGHLSSHA